MRKGQKQYESAKMAVGILKRMLKASRKLFNRQVIKEGLNFSSLTTTLLTSDSLTSLKAFGIDNLLHGYVLHISLNFFPDPQKPKL